MVEVGTGIDNTLFRFVPASYNPDDPKTWLKSNGEGNFFSAGLTNQRAQIQRGLLQFDLASAGIPAGAVVDSVSLRLYVVDVPTQSPYPNPDFWLVALPSFAQHWGEGTSRANLPGSGAGSGANATAGDATWYHTQYDPTNLDQYNPANTPPWSYDGTKPGFWPDAPVLTPAGLTFPGGQGALGDSPVTPLLLSAGYDPAGVDLGPGVGFVDWSTSQMAEDVQGWLDDPASNFGWIVLGIEDQTSSKRSFASFENTGFDPEDGTPYLPTLFVEYHEAAVPEPSSLALGLVAVLMGGAALGWSRRRGIVGVRHRRRLAPRDGFSTRGASGLRCGLRWKWRRARG